MAPKYEGHVLLVVILTILDILQVWTNKFLAWSRRKPEKDVLLERLRNAKDYEEWYAAAEGLDGLTAAHQWRFNPIDPQYNYRLIQERTKALYHKRRSGDIPELTSYLRHGLFRNIYGITKLGLYNKTYANTKENIHMCLDVTVDSIWTIAESSKANGPRGLRLNPQQVIDNIQAARQTYGTSALMLQGGSIFGLCHLGVVKALLEQNCLPRVIVGTATGALMAALVGIHTKEELPEFLSGERLDLSAFAASSTRAKERQAAEKDLLGRVQPEGVPPGWFNILGRRASRFAVEGFLLDPEVLIECIKANVGDITFAEAYERTGCILNIVVSPPTEEIPSLMNYLTAPNVLIRSAAMISHITNVVYQHKRPSISLLSKDPNGNIEVVEIAIPEKDMRRSSQHAGSRAARDHPTRRLRQQFNVDHFIISQARPYLAPFIQPSLPYIRGRDRSWPRHILTGLIKHTLLIADTFNLLPSSVSRILSDEQIQGDKFTLVPDLAIKDWKRMLKNPTKEEVGYWILKGERCVWPSLCALKARVSIENALADAWVEIEKSKGGNAAGLGVDKNGLMALPPQPVYRADEDEEDWGSRRRKVPAKQ
ncbi:Putative patatin-like phospholipase domain, Acyl transferase/acyl hydrolase/lysophospholipase [Septoria linicola]|uniref:Patatin-like phospholipase domain, Acyl transferase/acyl hydrolase/lysophospholipase n=1 Tax=Septoria linicola TaxID=215465 RepID=A0A9Q9APS2_9PEZI|nr:putative patatin-like phospholipase domain, Acyl transferase/acyl hydrolase/lysophospholipase [Septoria linicola]USW48596.1 Putative patatin-like phospholipase domain, Acyl transferase/acyl hydrolase/lysophospholipase [Septoria linicola]